MLQLYPSTQVDFTNNGEPIRHSFDEHAIREDGFYLTFKLLLDENEEYKKVKLENIIGAMTPDGMNYFKVYDVIPKTDHVEVIALQLFYYLDYRRTKPFNLKKSTGFGAIQALAHNFVSSIDPYTFDSSVNETHDFSVDTTGSNEEKYYNALEIANRIANRWDSEFMLNGYDVRMVKRLGKKTDALLYEKKNISEIEFENSGRSLVTRIYAVSRWTLDRDNPEFVEDADNDREIRVTVDSPLINEYSQIYEEEYTNNDLRTEQELINWASLKYSTDNVDKPSRSIELKANTVDGTEINYGDELVLKYLTHDIDETIRCVGYDFNPVTEDYYSVTLGDWRDSFGRSFNRQVADVSDRQQSQLDRLEREVQLVQMSANGKNRVTYGENPVPNPIDGDIWFYHPTDRPDEVELKIYNAESGQWERKDVSSEIIKQQFEEIDRIQQELIEDVEASENKAQQAIEDAGVAQATADGAYIYAQNILDNLDEEVSGLLTSETTQTSEYFSQIYLKSELLDGKLTDVLMSGTSQTAQYIQDYVIGEDYISEVIQTSDLIQSEIKRIVPVPTEAEIIALAEATQLDRADIEAMFEDGFLTKEDLDMIAELTGMTTEQVQFMVNNILNSELIQQYETVTKEVNLYEQVGSQPTSRNATHRWADFTFDFDLEVGKEYPFELSYLTDFDNILFLVRTVTPEGPVTAVSDQIFAALTVNGGDAFG
uniref:phage tail spike protein n=1 Tax=Jeotgalibaca porci TaxID=1868793 RepID=UPI0035A00F14